MAFVDCSKGEIGSIEIYNTNSDEGVLKSIAITKFVKSDESSVVVEDSTGHTIVVSGFPVIVRYKEEYDSPDTIV